MEFRLFFLPLLFLYISLYPQNRVVRLKYGASPGKSDSGIPLFGKADNPAKKLSSDESEFFQSFKVYAPGEKLPRTDDILYVDTVRSLKIENIPLKPEEINSFRTARNSALSSTGEKILLGIIDTGIDFKHPDIEPYMFINSVEDINGNGRLDEDDLNGIDDDGNGLIDDVSGYDFVHLPSKPDFGDYLDEDPWPDDQFPGGHGTPVAGAVIRGSFGEVRILNLRAGTALGYLSEDNVARAIYYGYLMNARIFNLSFGDIRMSRFLMDLINFMEAKNILFVASAGNSGSTSAHYPSSLTSVIAVGAVNGSGYKAGFSNYGYFVDVYSYGVDLSLPRPGGGRDEFSGTSFSAPLVSGACARLWKFNGNLNSRQIQTWVSLNASKNSGEEWSFEQGNGIFIPDTVSDFAAPAVVRLLNPPQTSVIKRKGEIVTEVSGLTGSGKAFLDYRIEGEENDPLIVETDLRAGKDTTIFISPLDSAGIVIGLHWYDSVSGGNVSQYTRFLSLPSPPEITYYRVEPVLDGEVETRVLRVGSDAPSRIDLNFAGGELLSSVEDTVSFLFFDPDYYREAADVSFRIFNEAGSSAAVYAGSYSLSSILSGKAGWEENILPGGSGYIWPEEISDGIYAGAVTGEQGALHSLNLYSTADSLPVFSFNEPWIIRGVIYPSSKTARILTGFGNNSAIFDLGLEGFEILNRWDFPGKWGVKFVNGEAVFRDGSEYIFYELNGDDWVEQSRLNSHYPNAVFSVPGLAESGDYILFTDVDGRTYLYKHEADYSYTYKGDFLLEGKDPGNMITGWRVDLRGEQVNTFWAVSEEKSERLSDASLAERKWVLEGFILEADSARRIARKLIRGVADRKRFQPSLGTVKVEGTDYLAMLLFPHGYLWSFDDSLSLAAYFHEEKGLYNYSVGSSSGTIYVNNGRGKVEKIVLSASAPELSPPWSLTSAVYDSSSYHLSWRGNAGAAFRVRRILTGGDTVVSEPHIVFPLKDFPFYENIIIRQEDGALVSAWSEELPVKIETFPVAEKINYYRNKYITVFFDREVDGVPETKWFTLDGGRLLSAQKIGANGFLLKVNAEAADTLLLSVRGIHDRNGIYFSASGIETAAEPEPYRPGIDSTYSDGNTIHIHFSGVFADSVLTDPEYYRLEPLGIKPAVKKISVNGVEIVIPDYNRYAVDVNLDMTRIHDVNNLPLAEPMLWLPKLKASDLSGVTFYPQPLRRKTADKLKITGVPADAKIYIYTPSGQMIRELNVSLFNQSLYWDLKNNRGNSVGSGVYIVIVKKGNEEIIKKIMVLR